MKSYDYILFIGRFQPLHHAHLKMIQRALTHGKKLILLCGSTNLARSARNPWIFSERETMIRASLSAAENEHTIIRPLGDNPYDDKTWVASIHAIIDDIIAADGTENPTIALFGHVKDSSSYYLDFFPQWDFIQTENIDGISATPLRTRYFLLDPAQDYDEPLQPEAVNNFLRQWRKTEAFQYVAEEVQYIQNYKNSWQNAPYPPIFTTTDALVCCQKQVLLVRRGGQPGKGLLALAGGFVNPDESLASACLRELKEETGLQLKPAQIGAVYTIDKPDRSAIGRVITHLHHIELPSENKNLSDLPEVHGADDAQEAFWQPIDKLNSNEFHDDHYFLIQKYFQKH